MVRGKPLREKEMPIFCLDFIFSLSLIRFPPFTKYKTVFLIIMQDEKTSFYSNSY